MKHILAGLILSMLFAPVMAEEQSQPTQPTTTSSPSPDKKADTTKPEEKTNIVDFCRTHTC